MDEMESDRSGTTVCAVVHKCRVKKNGPCFPTVSKYEISPVSSANVINTSMSNSCKQFSKACWNTCTHTGIHKKKDKKLMITNSLPTIAEEGEGESKYNVFAGLLDEQVLTGRQNNDEFASIEDDDQVKEDYDTNQWMVESCAQTELQSESYNDHGKANFTASSSEVLEENYGSVSANV